MIKCFACDRQIKGTPHVLTCIDEQTVHVGPCCFAKAENAGLDGYQPPKGGPRLYTLEAKARLLACDCQHPETTPGGFAAVSIACPIHGDFECVPEFEYDPAAMFPFASKQRMTD